MAHLSPSVALASCENAVRQLLTHALEEKYGSAWFENPKVLSADKLAKWMEKREVENAKRSSRGAAAVQTELLYYAEFYDLVALCKKHWDLVAGALAPQKTTLPLLERFDELRNTIAHGRDLLPFEEDLIAGIAGEIRNRVTIYMSSQAPSGEIFARVEEIVDNFGNRLDGARTLTTSNPTVKCDQILHPGDVVTWRCRGWDPQGRPLKWYVRNSPSDDYEIREVEGNDVEVSWTVTDANISSQSHALVTMKADSSYHRWSEGFDGMGLFYYQIHPKP
ncbi:hypothetical protein [Microbacterium phyllosphaerae]|uniref:hypothetical protein n=1 Tax=Microbacterium phyllosphaerae TaxID=124798 RepID=UPI002166D321|nr:hypothetical protein [Microbacterium phyllosphaerae]MCS3443385.1 hypothetical protein [Microbacterium phyllosphaerae]